MASTPTVARNGRARHPLQDRKRIRACSIALSSGSSLLGNLQCSELGQTLVATEEALVILSPLGGLHPTLAAQSRMQDIECHPDWDGRFPHSLYHINIKTFLENEPSIRRRTMLEADHSAVDARFLNLQWSSASWSKPGMGPNGSCLILATTSELDLFILGAPSNAWTGEWKLLHALDLSPVAHLTTSHPRPSPQHMLINDHHKPVFTPHRSLLRKKQMATEVLCASFCYLDRPSQFGDPLLSGRSSLPAWTAYILAGTHSGHIAVWQCHPLTGQCTFLSAAQVSETGIEQLMLTTQAAALEPNSNVRLAFRDSGGIKLCDVYVFDDQPRIQLSSRVPLLSHHCMISAWHCFDHHFIYSTIGRVHVYDIQTEQTVTYTLDTHPSSNYDPYSPAICISRACNADDRARIVLQDLREYEIPLLSAAEMPSLPQVLHPVYPLPLSGYPPLTETMQRKHDLHQAFLGYEVESNLKLPSASLVGAALTNERVAFLGYNVSETIGYQMEILRHGDADPAAVLHDALKCVASENGAPPYLVVHILLSLLYTSEQPGAFRNQLISAAEQSWQSLLNLTTGPNGDAIGERKELQHKQACLLYLLASRLEMPSDSASPLISFSKQHKVDILSDWLQRWLRNLAQRISKEQASDQDQKLLLRLLTAGSMLPDADPCLRDECTAAASALKSAQSSPVPAQDASVLTGETCAACSTQLTLSWDNQEQAFGWAKCQSGHVWPRCSVSLATISDRQVRACTGCWAKSLVPGKPDQSSWQTLMLEAASMCPYCESYWIVR
ncbi:hypothetical protein NDA18_002649 [Ustilago nuda]|nr:hypothetical protein NDA18_002649 [Ustilago nuda]